jgi:phosphoserine phosphatase
MLPDVSRLFPSGTKWYRQSGKYKIVAEKLGIHPEIIAVGNAGNDLTMIEYAGLVWVDNVDPN